ACKPVRTKQNQGKLQPMLRAIPRLCPHAGRSESVNILCCNSVSITIVWHCRERSVIYLRRREWLPAAVCLPAEPRDRRNGGARQTGGGLARGHPSLAGIGPLRRTE